MFSDKVRKAEDNEAEVKERHAKIGKLAVGQNKASRPKFESFIRGLPPAAQTRKMISVPQVKGGIL